MGAAVWITIAVQLYSLCCTLMFHQYVVPETHQLCTITNKLLSAFPQASLWLYFTLWPDGVQLPAIWSMILH